MSGNLSVVNLADDQYFDCTQIILLDLPLPLSIITCSVE